MWKRLMCRFCLLFLISIWVLGVCKAPPVGGLPQSTIIDDYLKSHNQVAEIYGIIYKRSLKKDALYLKHSYLKCSSEIISLKNTIVYLENPDEAMEYPVDASITVHGKLQSIPCGRNPGQFDSASYYETEHIYYRMSKPVITLKSIAEFSIRRSLDILKNRMAVSLEKTAKKQAPLFYALLLGDKSYIEQQEKDLFQMMGILHILAISGLHLSLLGMGCYKLLQCIGCHIAVAGGISVLFLFAYGIFTGERVSTMRAFIMFFLMIGARILGRSYDLLTAMSLSVILLLVESSSYLFSSGFILSYGSVLGITVVRPAIEGFLLADSIRKDRTWKGKLVKAVVAAGSIQVTTLPLTMYFFYEVPVYGVLMNLILLPSVSIALVCGFLGGVIGMWNIAAGTLLIYPGKLLLQGYVWLGQCIQGLGSTRWITGQPDSWKLCVYYGVLVSFLWITGRKKPWERNKDVSLRDYGIRGGIFFVAVALGVWMLPVRDGKDMTIACLDIGQGDGLVLSTPTGNHFLIDGGSSNVTDVGRYRIIPYLKWRGISVLQGIWVSHADSDHISGIEEILEMQSEGGVGITVKQLYLPDWTEHPDAYKKLEQLAKAGDVEVIYTREGQVYRDEQVAFHVLAPQSGGTADVNESSQVFMVDYGAFQGLFTGDIGAETEKKLWEKWSDVDYLKVAHHGSRYSTGTEFLNKIKPEIAVVSSSSTNTYGHPHEDTLSRLEMVNCSVWCTKDVGAVTVKTDGREVLVEGYLSQEPHEF